MINILEKDGAIIITIENPTSDEMKIISEAKRVKDAPASPVKKSAWNKPKTTATTDNPTESKKGWGNRKSAQTTTEKPTSWKSAKANGNETPAPETPAPVSKPTGSKWSKPKSNAPKQDETTPTIPKPAPSPTAEELAELGDEWELILDMDDVPF